MTGDMFQQGFQAGGGSGGGTYGPLVPQALSISQLSAWDGSTPYTANGSTLTLITVHLYGNPGVTLGMYTVVDDYLLAPDGTAIGTAPQRSTAAGAVSSQARDPRCPTTLSNAGTACDASAGPLECEYGGDALGRCTQSTACALQTDGSYHFQTYPSVGCDPNPAGCPASYDAADATSGGIIDAGYCAPRDAFFCNYPEGLCNCGSVSSALACQLHRSGICDRICLSPGTRWWQCVSHAATPFRRRLQPRRPLVHLRRRMLSWFLARSVDGVHPWILGAVGRIPFLPCDDRVSLSSIGLGELIATLETPTSVAARWQQRQTEETKLSKISQVDSDPNGIRTRVHGLKGHCPGPD